MKALNIYLKNYFKRSSAKGGRMSPAGGGAGGGEPVNKINRLTFTRCSPLTSITDATFKERSNDNAKFSPPPSPPPAGDISKYYRLGGSIWIKKPEIKNFLRLILLVTSAAFISTSCQKVINLDLSTASPEVVIIGNVTDQPGEDTVRITKTGSYFNPGNYPNVANAEVIISDNTGFTDTLLQVDSGVYVAPTMTGVPGRTYSMKVLIAGKEYNAFSTMPSPINIDSVDIYNTSAINIVNGISDTVDHVRCYFLDPPTIGHYYRVVGIVNGVVLDSADDFNLLSDEFDVGTEIDRRLSNCNPYPGQTVTVELECIDEGTYNYYEVVKSIASAGNPVSTAVPQNPPTNIMGGALGYFSAYTIRSATQVAP